MSPSSDHVDMHQCTQVRIVQVSGGRRGNDRLGSSVGRRGPMGGQPLTAGQHIRWDPSIQHRYIDSLVCVRLWELGTHTHTHTHTHTILYIRY